MSANDSASTATLLPDLFTEPPVEDWCFDLLMFYRSEEDEQSQKVLRQLETYSSFSVVVNGVITCFLASFGLIGNSMFVYQIHKSRYFSRRLASHLTMLCVWDMALLLCCLLTYGIISLYYGIIPFFGIVAYLLYFFQPFASFCVTGTIWQVLAITIERYTAVSRPLEQRTRNAQFSVPSITACIVTGAFLLNMVVVPIERKLTDCYEFTQNGFQIHTMIVQQPIVNNQFYAILVHLIPDIIFRAPTPIVAIAFLTVRTLQICSRRQVGTQTIQHGTRRNVPYMLTLLNVKFCLCNTLYLFNTILMEIMGYGGKTSSQQTELEMEQYVRSLYLTDLSNILLALHSATNFLIFYHWPTFRKQYKKYSNLTMTTVVPKSAVFDAGVVETLLTRFSANKQRICVDILATLCVDSSKIAKVIADVEDENVELSKEHFEQNASLLKHAVALADVIENVLSGLANKHATMSEWREFCRAVGYNYYEANIYCSADKWKLVRDVLVAHVSDKPNTRWPSSKSQQSSSLQRTMTRAFNYALREMKSGALCALVDSSHQHLRQKKPQEPSYTRSPVTMKHSDPTRLFPYRHTDAVQRRHSDMRLALLRGCESLSFIFPRPLDSSPSLDNSSRRSTEPTESCFSAWSTSGGSGFRLFGRSKS